MSKDLFDKCMTEGWQVFPWTKEGIPGKDWLKKDNVELYIQLSRKTGGISVEELLRDSEIIEGVSFITLESLIDFKREYGRAKDFEDIKVIEQYLVK